MYTAQVPPVYSPWRYTTASSGTAGSLELGRAVAVVADADSSSMLLSAAARSISACHVAGGAEALGDRQQLGLGGARGLDDSDHAGRLLPDERA
jgi:hypothetical protein